MKIFTNFLCFLIFLLVTSGLLAQTDPTVYNKDAYIVSQDGTFWVIDNGNFTLKSESTTNLATMANLKIEADASLTLTPASYLTVSGTLTNNSGTDGFIMQNGSSLLHDYLNVPATIQRTISGSSTLTDKRYHFVSIPTTQASSPTAALFLGSYLYKLLPGNPGSWVSLGTNTTTPLSVDYGYMIYYPNTSIMYSFAGNLQNGAYTFNLSPTLTDNTKNGDAIFQFVLVPNPYPSAIDWNAGSGWTREGINPNMWIWSASAGNYTSYILQEGSGYGTNDGIIQVGQSFLVYASTSGSSMSMNNNVRLHSNSSFLKSGNELSNCLTVTANANNYSDKMMLLQLEPATTGYDELYDARKLQGTEEAPQLYCQTPDFPLSINAWNSPESSQTFDIGYTQKFIGSCELTFEGIESFDPTLNIRLKDELTNQNVNLRNQQVYTFYHNPENAANRFKLIFGGTIGVDEIAAETNKIWISENTLYIAALELNGQSSLIEVFNVSGQKLISQTMVLSGISTMELNCKGFVVAKLTSGQKVLTTKGILMK